MAETQEEKAAPGWEAGLLQWGDAHVRHRREERLGRHGYALLASGSGSSAGAAGADFGVQISRTLSPRSKAESNVKI